MMRSWSVSSTLSSNYHNGGRGDSPPNFKGMKMKKILFLLTLLPVLMYGQTATSTASGVWGLVDRGGKDVWTESGGSMVTNPTLADGDSSQWGVWNAISFAIDINATIDSVAVSFTGTFSTSTAYLGGVALYDGNGEVFLSHVKGRGDSTGSLVYRGDETYWGVPLTQYLLNGGALEVATWVYDPHNDATASDYSMGAPTVTVYYHYPRTRLSSTATVSGSSTTGKPYTGSTVDTLMATGLSEYSATYLNIQSQDSASLTIKYQLSLDATHWGALTTADSLSTASNTGDVKSIHVDTFALGVPFIRFIISQNPSYRLGKSSAYYTTDIVHK